MSAFEIAITILWVFLPAAFSNQLAFLSKKIPGTQFLNKPVDMGIEWKGKRLLGANKTVRGFLFGTLMGVLVAVLQKEVFFEMDFFRDIIKFDYNLINPVIWGALLGFGALFGDAVESFFKRRIGIQPGKPFFPFDQTDFVFGAILLSLLHYKFPFEYYLYLLGIYFVGHILIKFIAYKLGIEEKPI